MNCNIFQTRYLLLLTLAFLLITQKNANSQVFTKVTDPNNPIVTQTLTGNYIGASWVDVNNDERLDLYVSRQDIFKNQPGDHRRQRHHKHHRRTHTH